MNHRLLEIATFTLEGALTAQRAGANRIELCDNANDGGTTPSYGMLKVARSLLRIPVFPIIRVRGGHFFFTDSDLEMMKQDILVCKELGYEGVVVGLLKANGEIDIENLIRLVDLASPMQVTFHRAFDRCLDPFRGLEQLIDSGCHRILTSGQFPSVENGWHQVAKLIQQANGRIIIMPGSGLNSKNIQEIIKGTDAIEYHTAARKTRMDANIFSPLSMLEKLQFVDVDEVEVKSILSFLKME